jgi:hypothetical protein
MLHDQQRTHVFFSHDFDSVSQWIHGINGEQSAAALAFDAQNIADFHG